MSLWDAILQGIIQGLTEFLPVSSSGHLSLYQHFTGQSGEAAGLFSILLHLGTLVAVCIAFWDTIWGMVVEFFRMIGDLLKGKFTFRTTNPNRRMIFMMIVALAPLLVFFFCGTGTLPFPPTTISLWKACAFGYCGPFVYGGPSGSR